MFPILLLVFVLVIIVVVIFYKDDEDSAREKDVKKRLEDEFIYDPDTGATMTLDQAEQGHFIAHDFTARIKSDHEIETNYSEEAREIEYIKRYFIERNVAEEVNEEMTDIIADSEISRQFNSFEVQYFWEYKPDIHFVIAEISNQYLTGREYETLFEYQLMVLFKPLSRYQLAEALKDQDTEQNGDWMITRFPRKALFSDLKTIMSEIESK